MKEWFKARNLWGGALDSLSDEDAGKLMKAIWHYTMNGTEDDLPSNLQGYFVMMLLSLKQDEQKEEETSKQRSLAGSKGGNQRVANQASASVATDNQANQANASIKNKNKNKNEIKNKEKEIDKEKEYMFERFWNVYPRHDSKATARKAFDKLNVTEELLAKIISAVEKQAQTAQWKENNGQYIPYAATWLNQKRWEDEVKVIPLAKTVNAQQYSQRDYTAEQQDAMRRMVEGYS